MSDENSQVGYVFTTPFGLKEGDFMRTVAKGNYTPAIHEFENLVIDKKVTFSEFRILTVIKAKTINFRNTHIRMRRKDIAKALKMDLGDAYRSIKTLYDKGYLLEKKDTDSYFFYAINPAVFGGTIILRSQSEVSYRLNVFEKKRMGIYKPNGKNPHGKSPQSLWEKSKEFMGKSHKEDEVMFRNYSGFEMLKYILLKYILLNGISAVKSQECLRLVEETRNPEFMIKQFSTLLQKQPANSRGIVEELLRANRDGTDGNGRPIKTNAIAYIITCWDSVKHHWQNLDHKIDMSIEAVEMRKGMFELIQEYEIQSNVVQLKKAGQ